MSTAMTRAPMTTASCVADRPTGPWPKMATVSPPCRLSRLSAPQPVPGPPHLAPSAPPPRRAGAGGCGAPRHEGGRLRRRPDPPPRPLNRGGVPAVAARAIDHRAFQAHLCPARAAVLAGAAAVVVVVHHALAEPGLLLADARAHRRDDAAGLVPGDHPGLPLDAARHCPTRLSRRAINVQIAAAHPRRLDLQDHVPRTRSRIGEFPQLQLAVSEKHDALHGFLQVC